MKTNTALLGLCLCVSAQATEMSQSSGTPVPSKTWLVLDDLAYLIYQNVTIDLGMQEVYAYNNDITNCAQLNSDPPLNTAGFTLITDTQDIGLVGEIDYDFGRKAIILISQTNDLVCDGAFEFDRIYIDDFE